MKLAAQCKFCGRQIDIRFDAHDTYDYQTDPYQLLRLLPLIACNRCADFRVERRRVFGTIKRLCEQIIFRSYASAKPVDEGIREGLREMLKRYMRLIAGHRSVPVPDWDEGILESVLARPSAFGDVLRKVSEMFKQKELPIQ